MNRSDCPEVVRGTAGKEVVWRVPTGSRIRQILRNPQYAGAFAYGRTGTTTVMTDGRTSSARRRDALRAVTVWALWAHALCGL